MPTVLRYQGFSFYFYSHEPNESPHIHVDKGGASAKFWLEPIALARNMGYTAVELRRIQQIAEKHQNLLLEKWHEYFNR
ncbi:MAG: DUF4160 domain-containing protein [Verrucomicrobiae bacterium]|nr:DUF4160 domain-containing protein [Verrucomicrobiae bacterium]